MSDQTPPLITEEQFNQQVRGWTVTTKGRMASRAPVYSGKESEHRKGGKLKQSLSYGIKMEFGAASRVRFMFERHGVFVLYGVGRGYIKKGNSIVRGTRRGRPVDLSTGFNRQPNDWFDVEIKQGLAQLAEITQAFYGDLAMRKILNSMDKFLIKDK